MKLCIASLARLNTEQPIPVEAEEEPPTRFEREVEVLTVPRAVGLARPTLGTRTQPGS